MALRPKPGMLTRQEKPLSKPAPGKNTKTDRAPPKPLPDTKESAPTPAPETENATTFTFFEGAERGDANPNALYARGEATQVTEAELREYFNAQGSGMLRQAFGDFDNYLAYMTEREQLIQSGDYDVGNWDEATGALTEDQLMILGGDDLTQYSDTDRDAYTEAYGQRMQEQSAAYDNWVNSEANQALLAKYGVGSTIYNNDGDKYEWNGSAYVKTYKVDDHMNVGDYIKAGTALFVSLVGAPAWAEALTAAGATAGSASAVIANASAGAIASAANQLILTGEVDLSDVLTAGAMAGAQEFIGSLFDSNNANPDEIRNQVQAEYITKADEARAAGDLVMADFYEQVANQVGNVDISDITDPSWQNVIVNLAQQTPEAVEIVEQVNENVEEARDEDTDNVNSELVNQILENVQSEPDRPPQEESFEPEEIEQEEQEEPNVIDNELEIQPPTLPVQEEAEEQEEESEGGDAGATPETQQEVPQEAEVVNIADENTIEDEDSELADTVPAEGGLEAETEEVISEEAVSETPIVDALFPEYADPATGVVSEESTPLDETANVLDEQQQESESDLSSQIDELGTSILGVEREVSDVERSLTEALEAATLNQATELSDAEARLLSEITGIEADILQQMAESEAGLQQELLDVGTNINQVRSDLQSQIQTTQQETAESLEQASDERRDLQQSIISVQGDLSQLDESTRQQFEEFGGTVNDLFSDVNVDIEALQEGQISQAEAQEAFESSVTEQFGELGGQVAGIGQGLEGLGEGIAGIGEGLGAGLMGLAAQQALLPGQIAAATPIQPQKFEKFQRGLTRRKLADPLRIGMFTGGARSV